MTGQRMWVRTLDGDAVAVDQIVRYGVAGLGDTGRAVLTVHTISDVAHHLGLFGSASQSTTADSACWSHKRWPPRWRSLTGTSRLTSRRRTE